MHAIMYSTRSYEPARYQRLNQGHHSLEMVSDRLTEESAAKAQGFDAVLAFVSDDLSAKVLKILATAGVKLIVCRSAGVDHVDLEAASALGIAVANCPRYSPAAVAEFAVGLLLALDRKIVLAHEQVLEHDFTLEALLGTELHGATVGIVGTGSIGTAFAQILKGFGASLLAYDPVHNPACIALGVTYCDLEPLLAKSDVVSLHAPLLPATWHLINARSLSSMKKGALLINTARGAVVDTAAIIASIEAGHLRGYAADVYEQERGVFFEDYSGKKLDDPLLEKLLNMRQVLLTPHQAFFTENALENMANNVFDNLDAFELEGQKGLCRAN